VESARDSSGQDLCITGSAAAPRRGASSIEIAAWQAAESRRTRDSGATQESA